LFWNTIAAVAAATSAAAAAAAAAVVVVVVGWGGLVQAKYWGVVGLERKKQQVLGLGLADAPVLITAEEAAAVGSPTIACVFVRSSSRPWQQLKACQWQQCLRCAVNWQLHQLSQMLVPHVCMHTLEL
jgi:hypothetical protein